MLYLLGPNLRCWYWYESTALRLECFLYWQELCIKRGPVGKREGGGGGVRRGRESRGVGSEFLFRVTGTRSSDCSGSALVHTAKWRASSMIWSRWVIIFTLESQKLHLKISSVFMRLNSMIVMFIDVRSSLFTTRTIVPLITGSWWLASRQPMVFLNGWIAGCSLVGGRAAVMILDLALVWSTMECCFNARGVCLV